METAVPTPRTVEPSKPRGTAAIEENYEPMGRALTLPAVVDALLKRPGSVVYELVGERRGRIMKLLAALALVCTAGYGFVMGSFSGGAQLWAVPLKAAGGMLAGALICLPSLYILASLSGAKQSLVETAGFLFMAVALSTILLAGFAPVAWIFSQSTGTVVFMGLMHLAFWTIALQFGLRLLRAALAFLNDQTDTAVLKFWSLVFLVVTLQMATTLRPLIGRTEGFELRGKRFFLAHWIQNLDVEDHPD